jgi:hypothetical protein
MLDEPLLFGSECFAAMGEGPKHGAAAGSEIRPPAALIVGFDVTRSMNGKRAQRSQVQRLAIQTPDLALGSDHKLHGVYHRGLRMMARRGLSTSSSSSDD